MAKKVALVDIGPICLLLHFHTMLIFVMGCEIYIVLVYLQKPVPCSTATAQVKMLTYATARPSLGRPMGARPQYIDDFETVYSNP